VRGNVASARALFADPTQFDAWVDRYARRMAAEDIPDVRRVEAMDHVNPIYIPRNHLVDAALKAAAAGDMGPFDHLSDVLSRPFTQQKDAEAFAAPAPANFGRFVTFCGT
jgi:uncharacterized protein YdiU (UPF0061 family)